MKMEFIDDEGVHDCPLIRLFQFETEDVIWLREMFDSLASGSQTFIPLHEQKGIEAVDGCRLDLRVGTRDMGIIQKGPLTFECTLTTEGWSEVASLAEPFCEAAKPGTFQWLNDDGDVSLLLSPDGLW